MLLILGPKELIKQGLKFQQLVPQSLTKNMFFNNGATLPDYSPIIEIKSSSHE